MLAWEATTSDAIDSMQDLVLLTQEDLTQENTTPRTRYKNSPLYITCSQSAHNVQSPLCINYSIFVNILYNLHFSFMNIESNDVNEIQIGYIEG